MNKNDIFETLDMVVGQATGEYIDSLTDDDLTDNTLDVLLAGLFDFTNRKINSINSQRTKEDPKIQSLRSPLPYQIACLIMRTHNVIRLNYGTDDSSPSDMCPLAVYNESGKYEGVYTTDESDIENIIRYACKTITTAGVKETVAFLRGMAPVATRCSDRNLIPVNNGVYDYENKLLFDFDPEFVFSSKIGTDYNPAATNVVIHNDEDGTDWDIESWIRELSDEPGAEKLFWQIIGASVRSNNNWNQAAFFYATKGNNGKGTFCRMIRNLIGLSNCCSIPLDTMGKDFMLSPLLKASAIVVDENNVGAYIEKTADLKALITDDCVCINIKHKNPVQYAFHGFMIQCLNDTPRFRDKTDSMLRRIIFVPFDKCFTGRERKYIKEDYLGRSDVLEYVLKHVLEDMPDYYSIEIPDFCKNALDDFRIANDNVAEFADAVLPNLVWDMIPWKMLYSFYKGWLDKYGAGGNNRSRVKFRDFTMSMRNLLDTGKFDWEYMADNSQIYNTNLDHMTEPEPLILELEVTELISKTYRGDDRIRFCVLDDVPERIRGIRRI